MRFMLVCGCVVGIAAAQADRLGATQASAVVSDDVRIGVPFPGIAAAVEFSAQIRADVVDGRVTYIQFVGTDPEFQRPSPPRDLTSALVRRYVGDWVFQRGTTGLLTTVITHRMDRPRNPCVDRDTNFIVNAVVPTSIEVISRPLVTFCDPSVRVDVGPPVQVPMIEGSVRCACPDNSAIAGAEVVLWKLPRDGERVREVRTDARGYFRIGGVAAGTYLLEIAADDHSHREVQVTVSQDANQRSIDALLEPAPPRPMPIEPDALVRSAQLATYPADARRSGVEGIVRLRLSMDANGDVDDIDVDAARPELRRAALANVRTWDVFMSAPVLTITYTYRLLPGDCTADQQPRITMRFPHVVEVTARRTIPCGG